MKLPDWYAPPDLPIPVNRSLKYDMAKNPHKYNNFPVITIGKRRLIPRVAFERWVETCGGTFAAIETATK